MISDVAVFKLRYGILRQPGTCKYMYTKMYMYLYQHAESKGSGSGGEGMVETARVVE